MSGHNGGGLIGSIETPLPGASFFIAQCVADINFSLGNNQSIGGLIGYIAAGQTVSLLRCYSNTSIASIGTLNRGAIVGALAGTVKMQTVITSQVAVPTNAEPPNGLVGTFIGTRTATGSYTQSDSRQITQWTGNKDVYTYLERRNGSGGNYGYGICGNESFGYDIPSRPKVTRTGYVNLVNKHATVNFSDSRFNEENGSKHYINADETLIVTPTIPFDSSIQRIKYSFASNYNPRSGDAPSETVSQDNTAWKVRIRVTDGTVSAAVENIPHPVSETAIFNQWAGTTGQVTVSWNYSNPDNLTGKFYVYRSETSGVWSRLNSAGISVANNANNALMVYNDTTSAFNKTYAYYIVFVEGETAPHATNPPTNYSATVPDVTTTPSLGEWEVTATGRESSIAVTFTADANLNGGSYRYAIECSVDSGAYLPWLSNQIFNGSTQYTNIDNVSLPSPCNKYRYKVTISAFGMTFIKETDEAGTSITGATKFASSEPFKASKGEYANYVRLQWKVDKQSGGTPETFRVFRRFANTNDPFTELETVNSNSSTVYWNDMNTLTGVYYEYKVTLYQVCNGDETESASLYDIGFTQSFGTVLGRVTYGSGNAVPGVNMLVRRNDLQSGENQYYSLLSPGGGQKFEWLAKDTAYFNNIWRSKQWSLQFWVNPSTDTGTFVVANIADLGIQMIASPEGCQIFTTSAPAHRSETSVRSARRPP
jgi:hypothetical protein